jgi:hypothetical protein
VNIWWSISRKQETGAVSEHPAGKKLDALRCDLHKVLVGYFESGGRDSFLPVIKSQKMKAHQITSRRSQRMAVLVTGFTNKNIGVRNSSSNPQNIFPSAL